MKSVCLAIGIPTYIYIHTVLRLSVVVNEAVYVDLCNVMLYFVLGQFHPKKVMSQPPCFDIEY